MARGTGDFGKHCSLHPVLSPWFLTQETLAKKQAALKAAQEALAAVLAKVQALKDK